MFRRLKYLLRKLNYILIILSFVGALGFYVISFISNSTFIGKEQGAEPVQQVTTEIIQEESSVVSDVENSAVSEQQNSSCKITIFDVGQASSALIESNGEYMLFDGGDRETSSYIVAYLKEQGITHIKYIVASHYHEDHIYGLIGVLKTTSVDYVICPDYVTDTDCYTKFISSLLFAERITPYVGQHFDIGDIQATVICPVSEDYSDDNGYSVGMLFSYHDFRFLINGDATVESEVDMLDAQIDVRADLLVVPHHGSNTSSSEEWIDAVHPTVAIISCGADNSYYHPHSVVLERLRDCGVQDLYRTDLQGMITITSDGTTFHVISERSATQEEIWKPGTTY